MHHPYLESIDLVIDPNLQALCCNVCMVALTPQQVLHHLSNKHPGLQLDKKHFARVVHYLHISDDLPMPSITNKGVMAFKGLKVLNGFACDHCPRVYTASKSMRTHHLQSHMDIPCPSMWQFCKMQQFNSGGSGLRTLWRVLDAGSYSDNIANISSNDIIKNLRQEMSLQDQKTLAPQDERIISPWLRTTRWHEHVENYDIQPLRRLVEIPGRDNNNTELPGIKQAVKVYFDEALAWLPLTDELVLQKLNSADPLKLYVHSSMDMCINTNPHCLISGINNTPFHRHQDSSTMTKYVFLSSPCYAC